MASATGFAVFDTPLGWCGIAWSENAIAGVLLPDGTADYVRAKLTRLHPNAEEAEPSPMAEEAILRVRGLLEGERDDLADLPLDMSDVPDFNRKVYDVARAIPPGSTMTYGEVAKAVGAPGASRAVGQALGNNPFAPVVPCHRVLAAANRSGGFSAAGGVTTKLKMLEIEGARFGEQPGLFDG